MRKQLNKWWLLLLAVTALIGSGCSLKDQANNSLDKLTDSIKSDIHNKLFSDSSAEEIQKNVRIPSEFVKAVDGDTAKFTVNGTTETVRFLLIDTPETVKPGTDPQLFGKEASEQTKKLLTEATSVEIELDQGQARDKYDRLLAYVFIDGELLQDRLVREGLARIAYINAPSTKYLSELQNSEKQAKNAKYGIWSIDGYATEKGFQN
ncbi:thermonuclease family protein [Enterococcus faecalis]